MNTEQLVVKVRELEARLSKLEGGGKGKQLADIATDDDLDGKWGDPVVRRSPPKWDGPDYTGKRYSETDPEFLRSLGGFLTWKARKQEETKGQTGVNSYGKPADESGLAKFSRMDAARAFGWELRLRNGYQAQAAAHIAEASFNNSDDDLVF